MKFSLDVFVSGGTSENGSSCGRVSSEALETSWLIRQFCYRQIDKSINMFECVLPQRVAISLNWKSTWVWHQAWICVSCRENRSKSTSTIITSFEHLQYIHRGRYVPWTVITIKPMHICKHQRPHGVCLCQKTGSLVQHVRLSQRKSVISDQSPYSSSMFVICRGWWWVTYAYQRMLVFRTNGKKVDMFDRI